MARLINGANGPFIGKAGSFIGYTVNGVAYMKGLYKKRTKAPTDVELLNRKKFAAAQHWLTPLRDFIKPGFKGYNERFQGFSAAKSWLMKNALHVVDGEVVIDPSLVKISSGGLPLPEDIACNFEEPNLIRFTWKPSTPAALELEQVMIAAYDVKRGFIYGLVYGNCKSTGEHLVPIEMLEGKTNIHCYLAFLATDRSKQSESIYLGEFELEYENGRFLNQKRVTNAKM